MKTHVNPAEALLGVKELESFFVWLADVNPELAGKIDGDESLTWNLYALFIIKKIIKADTIPRIFHSGLKYHTVLLFQSLAISTPL